MARTVNRDPHAPRLGRDLELPELTAEVFADESAYADLRLEGVVYGAIQSAKVELRRFVLTEVDLTGARLDGLDLEDGSIRGCNFAVVRSRDAAFERVQIEASRLTGATFVEPRLRDVVFRDSPMDLSSFRFGRLHRVRFEGCRLIEADFQGALTEACAFIDCDLTGAQFSQGSFAGSAFRGCRLTGLRGLEALKGAQMAWEDVLELAGTLAGSLGIEVRDDIA